MRTPMLWATAAAAAALVGLVMLAGGAEGPEPGAVPAKPRREVLPPTAGRMPEITPPPVLPDVAIPPIPEVDEENPFKPGPSPRRETPSGLIAEGKRFFNREGRLEMDPIGRAIFVFDSGERPMYLLENSWREYLEHRTDYGKKKARWRISGLVTVYGKRNYLLLTKCIRIEPEEEDL